jgi:hypothetical protein
VALLRPVAVSSAMHARWAAGCPCPVRLALASDFQMPKPEVKGEVAKRARGPWSLVSPLPSKSDPPVCTLH